MGGGVEGACLPSTFGAWDVNPTNTSTNDQVSKQKKPLVKYVFLKGLKRVQKRCQCLLIFSKQDKQ